jgi:hypothetical protein
MSGIQVLDFGGRVSIPAVADAADPTLSPLLRGWDREERRKKLHLALHA